MKIWMEISGERLKANFAVLQETLNETDTNDDHAKSSHPIALLAVVKANAYGHGIGPCAVHLAQAGAEWLGVTDASEGAKVRAELRAAGFALHAQPQILVMSGTASFPDEAEIIVREQLTAVVWNPGHLSRLAEAIRSSGLETPVTVHLEVDTGMSRQGVPPGSALDTMLAALRSEPRLHLGGSFTHFASTEVAHSMQTARQQANFESAVAQVAGSGLKPEWIHVGNSSFIDNSSVELAGPAPMAWLRSMSDFLGARAMVRSGLALHGYVLPIAGDARSIAGPRLLPVMTWKTRILAVSEVAAGALIGYNGTFRTERSMRIALLPVGYAEGLRRELSSSNGKPGGWVIIRGQRAPIVGKVSMNLTSVDVSEIECVTEGDEVVLLGDGITAEDHARIAGTIAYEIVCGVKVDE